MAIVSEPGVPVRGEVDPGEGEVAAITLEVGDSIRVTSGRVVAYLDPECAYELTATRVILESGKALSYSKIRGTS